MKLNTQAQFAAYYNMARRNINSILKHLAQSSGVTDLKCDEDKINDLKLVNILSKSKAEQREYLIKSINKHFPFVKTMTRKEQERNSKFTTHVEIGTVLTNIFKLIHIYRNNYTHFSSMKQDNNEIEKIIASYLNECFTIALRTIKERYELSEQDLSFINNNGHRYITTNDKRKVLNHKFEYSIINKDYGLSSIGKVFLVCLFIEKKYASMLFDALGARIYFNCNEKQKMIIRESFSVFTIRLPREKIDSERNDMTLAMDMLNELKKSPSELFDCFKEQDKAKFRISSEKIDDTTPQVLLRRSSDRFPQLALRYIDDSFLFKNIRFHVNYGKFRELLTENKNCIDGEQRVRIIQKELNGFGRINEVEKRRNSSEWDGNDLIRPFEDVSRDEVSCFPYITDSRTKYLFSGDKIGLAYYYNPKCVNGMYMPNVKEAFENIKPVCWLSRYEIPAMIFNSLLEMQICQNTHAPNTEKIIIDCVAGYRKFFEDFKEGKIEPIACANKEKPQKSEYNPIENKYNISWGNLPRKVRDYLTDRDRYSFNDYMNTVVGDMIDQTTNSLDRFREDIKAVGGKDNKMGKKGFVVIQPGRLASHLAEDILMMQPSFDNGKDKLTGLNYRVMQACIATYNIHTPEGQSLADFRQMFKDAKITGQHSNNPHPFLHLVLNNNLQDTTQFYSYYLKEKINYLEKIQKNKTYRDAHFLHPNRRKWAVKNEVYLKGLAEEYLNNPIELPRGLFEQSIKAMLKDLCQGKPELSMLNDIASKEQCSVTYLISKYMEIYCQDSPQGFYDWKREYNIFKTLDPNNSAKTLSERSIDLKAAIDNWTKAKRKELGGLSSNTNNKQHDKGDFKNALQQLRVDQELAENLEKIKRQVKHFDQSEKVIRRFQVQDILMFLMSKSIIVAKGIDISTFKLSAIAPNSDKGILSSKIPEFKVKISFNSEGETRSIIVAEKDLKIKNYSNFMRLLHDSRLESMSKHIVAQGEEIEVESSDLERELTNYDLVRPDIFMKVFEIEKSIVFQQGDLTEKEKQNFRTLVSKIDVSEQNREILISIRNKFGHNEYPYNYLLGNGEEKLLLTDSSPELPSIAKEILRIFEHINKPN